MLELQLASLLGDTNLNGGHLFGLVALRIRRRIANALVVVERGHTGGQLAARPGDARVRTVVDVGAAERLGDDGQRSAVDDDLSGGGKKGRVVAINGYVRAQIVYSTSFDNRLMFLSD